MTPIESTFSLDVNSKLDWSVCISLYILDIVKGQLLSQA